MKKFLRIALFFSVIVLHAQQGGMWIPSLLEGMNAKEMKTLGMKMSVADIYSVNKSSLKDAAPHFNGGCSSEIISDKGLLLTNHHCGYGQIQAHSTLQNDYLEHGFWAKNLSEELPNKDLKVTFIVRIDDVTKQVLLGTEGITNEEEKAKLIETNFHLKKESMITERFFGQCDLCCATSLLFFEKESVAQYLLHSLKYRGEKQIGKWLGAWLGEKIADVEAFQQVEVVIPVPLHKKKLRLRGYNQVALFGKELSRYLQATYMDDVLLKVSANTTQTKKISWRRLEESEHIFVLQQPERLINKQILLIDDLITTGATLSHCCEQLSTIEGVKIAVAGIGFTTRS